MAWSDSFLTNKFVKGHANGVVTHGSTEPILTVLDVRGFDVRDLFLIGTNDNCGSILVETESRAENIKAALEPAYAVEVEDLGHGCWSANFQRRRTDGVVPNWFMTNIILSDGRKVMENGRWT